MQIKHIFFGSQNDTILAQTSGDVSWIVATGKPDITTSMFLSQHQEQQIVETLLPRLSIEARKKLLKTLTRQMGEV